MCRSALMSGPLMIFCASNGTPSPSPVTRLPPSGTNRSSLPARTCAHTGLPSASSLNTRWTVPTTLPSPSVTRAPIICSACCVVIVTSPRFALDEQRQASSAAAIPHRLLIVIQGPRKATVAPKFPNGRERVSGALAEQQTADPPARHPQPGQAHQSQVGRVPEQRG